MDAELRDFLDSITTLLTVAGRQDFKDYVDDPDVASNELVFDNGLRLLVEPVAPGAAAPEAPAMGINPITIQPRRPDDPCLVLSRTHIGIPGSRTLRMVAAMLHHGASTVDENMVGLATYDEDTVINGLLHLFPNGELVPAEGESSESAWPCRKTVWETSDGAEWACQDIANDHQRSIDRDVTSLDEGDFNAWYIIETPSQTATIGRAADPADLQRLVCGVRESPEHEFHSGFSTKVGAELYATRKGLTVTDG